jgi:hypothetical protein
MLGTAEPNKMNSRGDISISSQGKSDESNTNISATFSCEICNGKFNSREELMQHTHHQYVVVCGITLRMILGEKI